MPPKDQNDSTNLHPIQAQKLETLYAPGQNAAPLQPQVTAPSPMAPLQQRSNKKRFIIIAIVVACLFLVGAAVLAMLSISADKNAAEFEQKTAAMAEDLDKQIRELQESFALIKEPGNFEESKQQTLVQQTELEAAEQTIAQLESDFKKLQVAETNKVQQETLLAAFEQAQAITDEYGAYLAFEQALFDAYGTLPTEVGDYLSKYREGGLRADFVTQTARLAQLSSEAKVAVSALELPADAQLVRDLYAENLALSEQTFSALKQHYETGNDGAIDPQLQVYSQGNQVFNDAKDQALAKYVESSELAATFKRFFNTISNK